MTYTTGLSLIVFLIMGALPALATFAIAILLIRKGKRGRIVNDHPICRACRFDLYNLPSEQLRCPECGADLKEPRAILPGHREPLRGPLVTGWALLALLLLGLAMGGRKILEHNDAVALKPDLWLATEARYASTPTQRLAWTELTRRAKMGGLSDDRAASLTGFVLAWQGDLKQTWMSQAGDFVEAARSMGQVTDEQWKLYAKQAPQLSLIVRPQVGRGAKRLPADIIIGKSRTGEQTRLVVRNTGEGVARGELVRILGEQERSGGRSGFSLSAGGSGSDDVPVPLDASQVADAAAGKRTVYIDFDMQVCEGWDDDAPVLVSETRQFQATWELVDAETPIVTLLPDDSADMRTRVEQAVKVDAIRVVRGDRWDRLDVDLTLTNLPVPLAHNVTFRAGEKEWKAFSLRTLPTVGAARFGYGVSIKNIDVDRVDVIFEPSVDAALETIHISQLWSGRIVIKDVNVSYETPATPP